MAGRLEESDRRVVFEALEPRVLLDGNVTAKVVKGKLRIRGDGGDNGVEITQGADLNQFVVTPTGSTTVNGLSDPAILNNVTKNVVVHLRGGDDELTALDFQAPKGVIVNMGPGTDIATVQSGWAKAGVMVRTGLGPDNLSISYSQFEGWFKVNTGRGDDWVGCRDVEVDKLCRIVLGPGDDVGNFNAIDIGGRTRVNTGPGNDEFHIYDTSPTMDNNFRGRFRLTYGNRRGADFLSIDNATFHERAKVKMKQSSADVMMKRVNAMKQLELRTGKRADTVTLQESVFDQQLTIQLGGGWDNLTVDTLTTSGGTARGGKGEDTLDDKGGHTGAPLTYASFEIIA